MTSSNFILLFRKMSKILPSCRSQEKSKSSALSSSSASTSSTTEESFNVSNTANNQPLLEEKTKKSPSNPSPLSSLSYISSASSIKDFHDIGSSSSPIFPWMMAPLPDTTWVFHTGFTPQPDSSAISALYWCHRCNVHIQGTVDHRCEWCDANFLPEPSTSSIPPSKKKSKWSRSLGRFFSH